MTVTSTRSDVLFWVRALQAGTQVESHSEKLFRHYYVPVRRFFERRGFPADRAEDLAQETFTRIFSEIQSYREGRFDAWVFAVAANTYRNEIRRLKTSKRQATEVALESDEGAETTRNLADRGVRSPEHVALERSFHRELDRAIQSLSPQKRRCLSLYLEDFKYREIASLLNITVGAVGAHIEQARRQLKRELAEHFVDGPAPPPTAAKKGEASP